MSAVRERTWALYASVLHQLVPWTEATAKTIDLWPLEIDEHTPAIMMTVSAAGPRVSVEFDLEKGAVGPVRRFEGNIVLDAHLEGETVRVNGVRATLHEAAREIVRSLRSALDPGRDD